MGSRDSVNKTISEVSAEIGVSPQTLRVWEAKGLLQPERTDGGQRRYSEELVARARKIADLRRTTGWNPAAISVSLGDGKVSQGAGRWSGITARNARLERGWTIQETARRAEISASYLSAIERGEAGGSTKVIAQLADAFGIPMSGLGRYRPGQGAIVRKDERPSGEFEGGVVWEELIPPGHTMEPALLIVPPDADSGGYYQRAGESFAFMLAGKLDILVDGDELQVLRTGDSIIIPAQRSFAWSNSGKTTARALWVEQLPTDAWQTPEAVNLIRRVSQRRPEDSTS